MPYWSLIRAVSAVGRALASAIICLQAGHQGRGGTGREEIVDECSMEWSGGEEEEEEEGVEWCPDPTHPPAHPASRLTL